MGPGGNPLLADTANPIRELERWVGTKWEPQGRLLCMGGVSLQNPLAEVQTAVHAPHIDLAQEAPTAVHAAHGILTHAQTAATEVTTSARYDYWGDYDNYATAEMHSC